jgi:hypothetical protein
VHYSLLTVGRYVIRNRAVLVAFHVAHTGFGLHPTSYPMAVGGSFTEEVKWPGREANHSPPASAEVKKILLYIRICIHSPYAFMA